MTTKALKVLRKVNFSLNESHTILFFDSFVYSESEDNDVRFSKTKVVLQGSIENHDVTPLTIKS